MYNGERGLSLYTGISEIVLLLQILSIIYPMLAYKGIAFDAPLVIYVQNEFQLRQMVEALNIFGMPTVQAVTVSPKELKNSLSENIYSAVVARFARGRYTEANLQTLQDECTKIDCNDSLQKLFIIISLEQIPAIYVEKFAGFIYLPQQIDFPSKEWSEWYLSAFVKYLVKREECSLNKMPDVTDEVENTGLQVFYIAAACFQEFIRQQDFRESDILQFEEKIAMALEKISSEWEGVQDPDVFAKAFQRALIASTEWLELDVCKRTEVNGNDVKQLDKKFFYDEDYYYLKSCDFHDICRPLTNQVSFDYLRHQLAESGVLVTEGRKRIYWTKEVELLTSYGYVIRKRFVKLSRRLIDQEDELSILERLEMKGENFHD